MKTKKLILCAAFGELAYTINLVVRFIISIVHPVKYHFDLLQDICQRSISDILLVCMIIACFALIQSFPKQSTKPFRIFTFCFAALLATSTITALIHPYLYFGAYYCFLPFWLRITLLVVGFIWLLLLARQQEETTMPKALKVIFYVGIALLALPIILEIISGISYLFSGHLLFLHSLAIRSWVRLLVPAILFPFLCSLWKTK